MNSIDIKFPARLFFKDLLLFLSFICFLSVRHSSAQNLVKNPSFELYETCPDEYGDIGYPLFTSSVSDWYRVNASTPDYYNSCSGASSFGVPLNGYGYQFPFEGNGYIGLAVSEVLADGTDFREYVQSPLISRLKKDHQYYIHFWISLFNGSSLVNDHIGIDKLSAYCSPHPVLDTPHQKVLSGLEPQFTSQPGIVYTDTQSWTNVTGTFAAEGNEEWIVLGSFHTTPEHEKVIVQDPYHIHPLAYYYFDNICLLDLDGMPAEERMLWDTIRCSDHSISLNARADLKTMIWSTGEQSSHIHVNEGGKYWVKMVDTVNCIFSVDTFYVTDISELDIDLGNDTFICPGVPFLLDPQFPDADTYLWSTTDTTPTLWTDSPGTYIVQIQSACKSGSDTITLEFWPEPEAILPGDTFICAGSYLDIGYEQDHMQFFWESVPSGCCTRAGQAGTYIWTVENKCGIQQSDTIHIDEIQCNDCLLIPSAFSPNGDGLNDRFHILNRCRVYHFQLQIYDRWGNLVFKSFKIEDEWDGTINHSVADQGVYFYIIQVGTELNAMETYKGDLTLIQ